MEKTFEIGQLQLHNHTVREAIMQVERMMAEGAFLSVEEVTVNTVLALEDNAKAREGLGLITNTVIADAEILQTVGLCDMQRKYESEHHEFFFELFKRLERNSKTVYVLGKTQEDIEDYSAYMTEQFPKLKLIGRGSTEECIGNDEALVNEINSLAPDAIISLLTSPEQEIFYLEHKGKLSTGLWYGMGEIDPRRIKTGLFAKIRRHRRKKLLERHIHGKV